MKGYFIYKDEYLVMQHDNIISCLRRFFSVTDVSQILEIGTFYGGLSYMIRDILDEYGKYNVHIRSYDVERYGSTSHQEHMKGLDRIEFIVKNLFGDYSSFPGIDEVRDYVSRSGRTIVFCDGGCKKAEFNYIVPILKKGDIILAHDYSPSYEYFEKNIKGNIWDWCEITDDDVNDVCQKYNMQPYMQDDFINVVWISRIKN